ncbi:(2Fe-2S)-binding protein [Ruegeria sp.]|uniref:(2Fe-2S)-binding protein n=1 Tax=Ruegeria sp. TaxID=1879320 RepID=UPI003AFFD7DC
MNMGEEVSHLKAHVNTFYNNGALQRASEQPHLKTNQKPSQINKKVGSQEDGGPIVCSCFGVGLNTIVRAIGTQNIGDVDEIGRLLQAGTNCGSCRPELSGLLAKHSVPVLQDVEP